MVDSYSTLDEIQDFSTEVLRIFSGTLWIFKSFLTGCPLEYNIF